MTHPRKHGTQLAPVAWLLMLLMLGSLFSPPPASAHNHGVWPGCTGNPYQNPYFFPGGPISNWAVHAYDPSPYDCHWFTATKTGSVPINTLSWYLETTASYNHYYRVYDFIPCDGHASAAQAKFRRYPHGTLGGFSTVTRGLSGYCNSYMNVTNYTFYGAEGGCIQMIDVIGNGYAGEWLPGDYLYYTT